MKPSLYDFFQISYLAPGALHLPCPLLLRTHNYLSNCGANLQNGIKTKEESPYSNSSDPIISSPVLGVNFHNIFSSIRLKKRMHCFLLFALPFTSRLVFVIRTRFQFHHQVLQTTTISYSNEDWKTFLPSWTISRPRSKTWPIQPA